MSKTTKVVIAGIHGRMGRASALALSRDPEIELTGAFGRKGAAYVGQDLGQLINSPTTTDILIGNGIEDLPAGKKPDVLLDFSLAEPAFEHAKQALSLGIRPVIGVSGLGEDKIKALSELATAKGLGALVVPNFSLGAVLMIEFARQAGGYFSNVEIVETHQPKKLDAPSGTAMYTTRKLDSLGAQFNAQQVKEHELLPGARGAKSESGVRVHSLRLPGLISRQEVTFGAAGELLTVRHESFNTDCFDKGICLAVKAVGGLNKLVVGLEHILNLNGNRN